MDAQDHDLRKLLANYPVGGNPAAQLGIVDFCLVLLRQKHAFVISIALSVFVALLIGLFVPRPYGSQAVVEIGSLGFDRPILEPTETVAERLRTEYEVGTRVFAGLSQPFVSDIKTSRHASNYIVITTAGRDGHEARDLLQSVVKKLIVEHRAVMQSGLTMARMQLRLAADQMVRVQENLAAIEDRLQRAVNSNSSTAVVALLADKHRLMEQSSSLEQLKVEMQAQIAEAEARTTRIIKAPTLPDSPTGWSLPLYLGLGLVAGFALGILTALGREFLSALRARRDLLGELR